MMSLLNLFVATNILLSPIELKLNDLAPIETDISKSQSIYLVRHGESFLNLPDSNGIRYTSGKSLSSPLTDHGRKQASSLGNKLIGKLPFDGQYIILSSTALRAQETADRLFEEIKSHYDVERGDSYDNLCELGQGIWEGQPRDEKYDLQVKIWDELSAKDKFTIPKLMTGESFSEVATRALIDLQQIVDRYPDKIIIIITHYAAMNALALQWSSDTELLSEDLSTPLPSLRFNNCDILKVELPEGNLIDKAKVQMHIKSEV